MCKNTIQWGQFQENQPQLCPPDYKSDRPKNNILHLHNEVVAPTAQTAQPTSIESPTGSTGETSPKARAAKKKPAVRLQLKIPSPFTADQYVLVEVPDMLVHEDNERAKLIMFDLAELGLENSITLIGLSHWPNETKERRQSLHAWLNYLTLDLLDKAFQQLLYVEWLQAELSIARSDQAAFRTIYANGKPIAVSARAAFLESKLASARVDLDIRREHICAALDEIINNRPIVPIVKLLRRCAAEQMERDNSLSATPMRPITFDEGSAVECAHG